jgi:hypothetical protein
MCRALNKTTEKLTQIKERTKVAVAVNGLGGRNSRLTRALTLQSSAAANALFWCHRLNGVC